MRFWQKVPFDLFAVFNRAGETLLLMAHFTADFIWANFFCDWYGIFTQNCQNFARMLFERVAIERTHAGKEIWDSIPDPVGYQLANGARLALAAKMGYGTTTAYLGTVANVAPVAQAGQGVEAAGMIGFTSGKAGGGTTAGVTTAGNPAAGGGTVTSSHVGFGAKAAGLMHGGHAAAIGTTMVKAGAVAVLAHPFTGLAVTGGLVYLAIRGKRGKGWNKKNMKTAEMDVFHLLVLEEEGQLVAERNDLGQFKVNEELAEEPRLELVDTEPGTGLEKHQAVPALQDIRPA